MSGTVHEVINGSLPTQRRQELLKLIEAGDVKAAFIESCRALARSVKVSEELYEKAVRNQVSIIPADLPDLLKPDTTPAESFVRRIIFASTELERDLVVSRLQDGIRRKLRVATKVTQAWCPKATGCHTTLDMARPSAPQRRRLRALAKKHRDHPQTYGLRSMASDMSEVLKLDRKMGHETARRLCRELQVKGV